MQPLYGALYVLCVPVRVTRGALVLMKCSARLLIHTETADWIVQSVVPRPSVTTEGLGGARFLTGGVFECDIADR